MCVIDIKGEEPITYKVYLDEPNQHQTKSVKSKFSISLCISKGYHIADLEDIHSIFDQVRTVISHLEVLLSNKPPTPRTLVKD